LLKFIFIITLSTNIIIHKPILMKFTLN